MNVPVMHTQSMGSSSSSSSSSSSASSAPSSSSSNAQEERKKRRLASFNKEMSQLGCILPILVMFLILCPYLYLMPFVLWHMTGFTAMANITFCTFIVVMILYTYMKSIFTSPGTTSLHWGMDVEEGEEIKKCDKCDKPKPPRAHHCSVCNKCVLRMDHHCPWINNCVGYYNHKYFLLFLLYATTGIFYAICVFSVRFYHAITDLLGQEDFGAVFSFTLGCAILLPVGIAICALLSWQLCLLGTGMTSIESEHFDKQRLLAKREGKKYSQVNLYDLGYWANLKSILGPDPMWWLVPSKPKGSGTSFKKTYQRRSSPSSSVVAI